MFVEVSKTGSGENEGVRLLQAALKGEALAIDRLLLFHVQRLSARIERRLPRDVRAAHAAEDILQDTLAECFHRFLQFQLPPKAHDPSELFFAWLSTMADHRLIDLIRAQRAQKRGGGIVIRGGEASGSLIALVELVTVHERTPSRSASGHEAERAIRQAIESLSPDYRQVLELRYLQGLSPADVAARMQRSEHAIHNLCGRAIGALREAMGDPSRFLSQT